MRKSTLLQCLALVASTACRDANLTTAQGTWEQVDLVFSSDGCGIEAQLVESNDPLQFRLGVGVGSEDWYRPAPADIWSGASNSTFVVQLPHEHAALTADQLESARQNYWNACYGTSGPYFLCRVPTVALWMERWADDLFFHEDCEGQPLVGGLRGTTDGMIVDNKNLILTTAMTASCIREGEDAEFRWCSTELTSHLRFGSE